MRPVAVIGAGVAGLTTACELLARGARVEVFAREVETPSASSAAPAMFTPYAGPEPERFERWTRAGHARLQELARRWPESGVTVGVLREYRTRPGASEPWLRELLEERVRPGAGRFVEVAETRRPHMDTRRYLPWLRARVWAMGGTITRREFVEIGELQREGWTRVVLCAGVGAGALAADGSVRAIHGQVVHVPNDVGLAHSLHDDAPGGVVTYVCRLADRLVLGGTLEEGRQGGTDDASIAAIIARARVLLAADGVVGAERLGREVLWAAAGQRPARGPAGVREQIRLEAEGDDAWRVVHHYGHGRMGVSVSWATASEAAELVLGGPGRGVVS